MRIVTRYCDTYVAENRIEDEPEDRYGDESGMRLGISLELPPVTQIIQLRRAPKSGAAIILRPYITEESAMRR